MQAMKQKNIANKYKNLKPKYIELYSSKPPTMAPSMLHDKALAVDPYLTNSLENASPEKNTGNVKTIGIKNFNKMIG